MKLDPDYVEFCRGIIGYLREEGANVYQIDVNPYPTEPMTCWNCVCNERQFQLSVGDNKIIVHTLTYRKLTGEPHPDWYCNGDVRTFDLCDPESLPAVASFLRKQSRSISWERFRDLFK